MHQRLALATLVVPDYDDAIAFFTETLSFRLVEDTPQGAKRWVVVAPAGGAGLLIAKASSDAQTAAIGHQTGGRVAFFLETDDFDRDHAAMRAKGVEFLETPRNEAYGKVAQWRDPWGNLWDLIEKA
ncbi:MAG: VOC family protein [Pseudomonadota bacterium]